MGTETPERRADLREHLRVLWRRKWWFLLPVVLIPVAVLAWTAHLEKEYQSSVLLQIQTADVDSTLLDGGSTGYVAPNALAAAARLVETSSVAQEAARQMRVGSAAGLGGAVTATPDKDTGFITLTATSSTASRAQAIADAYSRAVVTSRARQARGKIDRAIARVQQDLPKLARDDVDGRRQLSQQLQRFRALKAAQGQNAQVVEPAGLPQDPVSPHPWRNAALALILAVFAGGALVLLAENLDRRIRHPEELERLSGTPLLATIPEGAFPGNESSPQVSIAFQGLRDTLRYFNVERPTDTIAVTSPTKGDGKTTVATNVAGAMARAGQHVILVDADLRHPRVAERMGIESSNGLSNLLAENRPAESALVEAPLFGKRLRVLTSGPIPPNPSELLGSERMRNLIEELRGLCDVVVIDTTPVLAVSDALPLLDQVAGTIVVAKLDSTPREAVVRLMQVAGTGSASILGVVATGAKPGGLYTYGLYGYGPPAEEDPAAADTTDDAPANGNGSPAHGIRGRLSRS